MVSPKKTVLYKIACVIGVIAILIGVLLPTITAIFFNSSAATVVPGDSSAQTSE